MLAGASCASGAITNSAPWSESFETFTNGTLLDGTNGWTGSQGDAGIVTSTQEVVNLLTNYPVSGKTLPLSGSHTNVVVLNAELVNHIQSTTGGVVKVDFMVRPTWSETPPTGNTNKQYAFCIATNGLLTLWHYNRMAGSNEWRTLAASPVISTNDWSRFTVVHDYSNKMFQIVVNEGTALTDPVGWTAGGASASGSWFYMVQTNGFMSRVLAEAAPAFIDDVVVARRSLSWSRTNFAESVTNNGAIDNSSPLLITLAVDTFDGSANENFVASGKATVSGLPANLVAVVQRVSPTQLSVTLTNTALAHEPANNTNLVVQLVDTAFAMRNAWDVTGSQTNVALTFLNTPRLGYSTNHFYETSTNNGSIDNSTPLLITLTNGTFSGTVGEDFATNAAKLAIVNLPTGLISEAIMLSDTQVQFRLLGAATLNGIAQNISTLNLTFQNGAFNTVPASSVFNVSTNLSVSFIDPSTLSYGTTIFTETVANNGAVNGATLTLVNKSFNATNGEDLVASGKVTASNLPASLGLHVVRGATAQDATVSFSGTANAHAVANNVVNLGITFLNTAFVGANAAAVTNYTLSNLQIQFTNPRSLAYSRTSFTEISGGAIDNRSPATITLTGDTLTGADNSDFVAANKITVGNVPFGLTAVITKTSATQLSIQFSGRATANAPGDSVSTISFTFNNTAFTAGNAIYVNGYANTGISITFITDSGFFNVMPYQESFEGYHAGLLISGTNGWLGNSVTAGIVTNGAALTSSLAAYVTPGHTYPISSATHTQELYVQDSLRVAVRSETAANVYLEFMTIPVPMTEAPVGDTNQQWAFYVRTNGELVVWQQTRSGGPAVNEWITLSNAPAISTSQWSRFTIENDYTHDMFRLMVNQGAAITDSRGWTAPGGSLGGPWFYMVQTNHVLAAFKMTGGGDGTLDDLTVNSMLDGSFYPTSGAVYMIR